MIGKASDGDPRLLNAMKTKTNLDLTPETIADRIVSNSICVQDTIHIGTKLRNRLLNSCIMLIMGNFVVTVNHIKAIPNVERKEVHGLVFSDIQPEDKQNYKSLEKIMDKRVLSAIECHVPYSNATIIYLKLCERITSSFLAENLNPIERVYKLWRSIYLLRAWRKWLKNSKSKGFTVTDNFISSNSFACIELNGHALIDLIIKLRNNGQSDMFIPILFSSQPCEYLFRKMRSMSTANYTKINFSLNELLHLIARVEMMTATTYTEKDISFPRIQSKLNSGVESSTDLPDNLEISCAMERALKDALEEADGLGMFLNASDVMKCEIATLQEDFNEDTIEDYFEELFESTIENERLFVENESVTTNESRRFVDLIDDDGSVKKSENLHSFGCCWKLEINLAQTASSVCKVPHSTKIKVRK